MKTKIKVTIGDTIYEIESSRENYMSDISKAIEDIVKQHKLLIEKK